MIKRILVVDDEKSITTIISKIASDLGHQVLACNRTDEALEAFDSFRPDVLMLDIVMPGADGIDVLRHVLAKRTDTTIVIMTGFGEGYLRLGQAVAEFCDRPAVAKLAKPFRRADIAALLGEARPAADTVVEPGRLAAD